MLMVTDPGIVKACQRAWSNGKGNLTQATPPWSAPASKAQLCEAQSAVVEVRRQITQECAALIETREMVKAFALNEICEMISKSLTNLGHAAYALSQIPK
jgi:hypothetical protein